MEEKLGGYEDYFIKYLHNKTNWYPYFVDKILYASDPVLMETTELDISHLAFRPVLIDYSRFGICFALDTTWLFREDKRNKDLLVVDLIILFHSRMPDDQQVCTQICNPRKVTISCESTHPRMSLCLWSSFWTMVRSWPCLDPSLRSHWVVA